MLRLRATPMDESEVDSKRSKATLVDWRGEWFPRADLSKLPSSHIIPARCQFWGICCIKMRECSFDTYIPRQS
jgi:hypothetical protein